MLTFEVGRLARMLFQCQGTARSHLTLHHQDSRKMRSLLHTTALDGILVPSDLTLTYGIHFSYCCNC